MKELSHLAPHLILDVLFAFVCGYRKKKGGGKLPLAQPCSSYFLNSETLFLSHPMLYFLRYPMLYDFFNF